jgi:hypothetical protein
VNLAVVPKQLVPQHDEQSRKHQDHAIGPPMPDATATPDDEHHGRDDHHEQ